MAELQQNNSTSSSIWDTDNGIDWSDLNVYRRSHPHPSEGKENPLGETIPRVHPLAKRFGLTTTYDPSVSTLRDHLQYCLNLYSDLPYLGKRVIDKDGTAGPYVWISYKESLQMINEFSAGLRHHLPELERQSNVGLFSVNRFEWMIADLACFTDALVAVPLYDTLGLSAIEFICNHAELSVIVASLPKVEILLGIGAKLQTTKAIVSMDGDIPSSMLEKASSLGIKLISFGNILKAGQEISEREPLTPRFPFPDDLAVICYTSGTTGNPKGVLITHRAFISMISSMLLMTKAVHYKDDPTIPISMISLDREHYLSYLPLAHIYEHLLEMVLLATGTRTGFSQGDQKKIIDDVGALRPTGFAAVPRVLQRIYDRVMSKMQNSGHIKKSLFQMAYESKLRQIEENGGVTHWLWDRLVFKVIKDRLGGRVKVILSAGAPLSDELMNFSKVAFGCDVFQAYGQTETCGAATFTQAGDFDTGHVGLPVTSVEIKLVDIPEMKYFSTDQPYPRGEICIRGPSCFIGYYKEPQLTAETLDADGWVHTGDVGVWDFQGRLILIDRKKHIFKLSQGEYIAPERIENIMLGSPFIGQIFVHGDSHLDHLVAIVVPDFESLLPWLNMTLQQESSAHLTRKEICAMSEVSTLIMNEIQTLGKSSLKGFEIPRRIHLHHEEFSVENGMMTSTMKIRRQQAREFFAVILRNLYSN